MPFEIHHMCRNIIFPEFYFSGRKNVPGDREFITKCLAFLSESNQRMACEHYRDLYLRRGRKEANTFIKDFSNEFGVTRAEYNDAKTEAGGLGKKFTDIIERIKQAKKGRISIIGMAEPGSVEVIKDPVQKAPQKRERRKWSSFEK